MPKKKPAPRQPSTPPAPDAPDGIESPAVFIKPKYDFMIKGVFGERDGMVPLVALLKALFPWMADEEFEDISFPDTHRKRVRADGKECFFDVYIRFKSGRMVDIEVQLAPLSGIFNRSQYSNARMMEEQANRGGDYAEMATVITVFIMDHVLFNDREGYFREYWLMNPETRERLPDSQGLVYVELPKVPREDDGSGLWRWMRFLLSETREEMEAISAKEPAMAIAATRVLTMSADESNRLLAISRDKWRLDQLTMRNELARANNDLARANNELARAAHAATTAHERGLSEGKAEGKAEARLEIARSLLISNMSLDRIVAITGLSLAEVERLAKEIKA